MHRGVWASFLAILILGAGGIALITYGVNILPTPYSPDNLSSTGFKLCMAGCGLIAGATLYGFVFCCCLWPRLQEQELNTILAETGGEVIYSSGVGQGLLEVIRPDPSRRVHIACDNAEDNLDLVIQVQQTTTRGETGAGADRNIVYERLFS